MQLARKTDWNEVPFGTKVRVWDYNDEYKHEGRFICCDEDRDGLSFLVFIEHVKETYWFCCCELIEGGDIIGQKEKGG